MPSTRRPSRRRRRSLCRRTVAVAAAGDGQSEFRRPLPQFFRPRRLVGRVVRLDRLQPHLLQASPIARRKSQPGGWARLVTPPAPRTRAIASADRQPHLGNVGRAAVGQPAGERLAHRADAARRVQKRSPASAGRGRHGRCRVGCAPRQRTRLGREVARPCRGNRSRRRSRNRPNAAPRAASSVERSSRADAPRGRRTRPSSRRRR